MSFCNSSIVERRGMFVVTQMLCGKRVQIACTFCPIEALAIKTAIDESC